MVDPQPEMLSHSESLRLGDKAPTVSVVIPCHKRANLLRRAIQSVVAQTFSDWELIVVDDGSEEDLAEVVQGFRDPRMRLIRCEHRSGGARARNIGTQAAHGAWVAFLDSDDEWQPQRLAVQISQLQQAYPDAAVGYCLVQEYDHQTREFQTPIDALCEGHILDQLLKNLIPRTTSAYMVKRCALLDVGGFDERMPSWHDIDLWLRLALKGYRFAGVSNVLIVTHRYHGPQISRDPIARLRGLLRLNRKWKALMMERLGPETYWQRRLYRFKKLREIYQNFIQNQVQNHCWIQAGKVCFSLLSVLHQLVVARMQVFLIHYGLGTNQRNKGQ